MRSDPHYQPAGRPGRGVLLCSAGLNLLLLAVVLGLAGNPRAKPSPPLTRTLVAAPARPVPAAAPGQPGGSATNSAPFRWAQLEAEDFRIYVANLRAARCPERIIRDLVFHDLERLYAAREAARPSPELFWKSVRVREAAREETERRRRQMELEKRAVMRELLGVWWSKPAWEFWYGDDWADLAEFLVGFLTTEQVLETLTLHNDLQAASSQLAGECELCSEADEIARQQAAYRRSTSALAEIMSPAELEELALRTCLMERDLVVDPAQTEFRFRSGTELRDFVKLVNRVQPFFSQEFVRNQHEGEARQAQLESEMKSFFGEDRFAVWERSKNAGYQELWQFGQEQKLPPEAILKAWQVRTAVEQEFSRLAERTELSPAEQAAAWAGVRQQTQAALTALLGSTAGTQYLEKHGDWLKAAPPNPGGKP